MDENDWLRLTRYIAGEAQGEERRDTERWIAAVPARAELAHRLRVGWGHAGEAGEPFDAERAWDAVVRRKTVRSAPVAPGPDSTAVPVRPLFGQVGRPRSRGRWWSIAAAASVILALGAGATWWSVRDGGRGVVGTSGPLRTVVTRPGQMADVYLSDGTHVRLGAASTLRFPTKFGAERRVFLEGEGYFDVVHDTSWEFAVHTAQAVARDVGTRFGVRAYSGSATTEVVVAEGAVALKPAADRRVRGPVDSILLTPADLGRVDASGKVTMTRQVDVQDYLAWIDGQLVFADTPLRDALPRLSHWYGIDLTAGDPRLADVRLTATLEAGSLAEALRRLSAVLDVDIRRQGASERDFVLFPKRRVR